MAVLKTAAFLVLAGAFLLRIPRAARHPEARLTWLATGIGALALLTLGTLVPQADLDAPLGGRNLIKLVQTSLAIAAIWLGAQAAITLGPSGRRMTWPSLAVMVALPAIAFLFIRRTAPTSQRFLDDSIRQFPAWLYATLYLAALTYVSTRLIVAFRRHREAGARLIKAGAAILIAASIVETLNFTLQILGRIHGRTAAALSAAFNIAFYPGVCVMSLGVVAYTSARTLREWQIPRLLKRLTPLAQPEPDPPAPGQPALARLYLTTVTVRDLMVAGRLKPNRRQLRALHRGERIIAHSLTDPPPEGPPTVTTYPGTRP